MKYLFTLVFALLAGVATTTAQTVTITKTDGSTVKYKASEIKSIQFANEGTPVPPAHSFKGYLLVGSPLFTETYYGEAAKMEVTQKGGKSYCKFTDDKWGTGEFEVTLSKEQISGKGKLKVANPHNPAAASEYDATMSGSMTAIDINVPGLMNGTTIKWRFGSPTEQQRLSGTYMGENQLTVMFQTFTAKNSGYCFWVNDNKTYSIKVLAQKIEGTPMGNITLGEYTINNVSYDAKTKTFSKDYTADNITMKYSMGGAEKEAIQKNASIKASFDGNGGLKVEHTFKLGAMPFQLTGAFNGKIKK